VARRSDPTLDAHFDRSKTAEPILVKNIENVQGDERDVIIFSVAVGPDKAGRITAQISSLNTEGGQRRLNVAVTRARRELLVFASLRPEQIDLGRTSATGVIDFKHFLEFADKGARAIAESFAPTGRGTDSPFEDAVMRALQARGWQVHPQVGVSFFRIDLGIVHPEFPGRYLAGVECDGATYHRSATARDRDRLREMVLTDLGWRIRRIWSTEWWIDAASAAEKIHARLTADLAEDLAGRPPEKAVIETDTVSEEGAAVAEASTASGPEQSHHQDPESPVRPEPANDSEVLEPAKVYARGPAPPPSVEDETPSAYVAADPSAVAMPDKEAFYDTAYLANLRQMIDHIVDVEAPIYVDLLIERIARAHGFQRTGGAVQSTIGRALNRRRFTITADGDREIIWPKDKTASARTTYRGAGDRDHADIPLPELAGLADLLRAEGLEHEEELIRAMQEHFNLGRLASSTRERFKAAVQSD
jgi:very-short-patch-repair endonuclease